MLEVPSLTDADKELLRAMKDSTPFHVFRKALGWLEGQAQSRLLTCSAEELPRIQGEVRGYRAVYNLITLHANDEDAAKKPQV